MQARERANLQAKVESLEKELGELRRVVQGETGAPVEVEEVVEAVEAELVVAEGAEQEAVPAMRMLVVGGYIPQEGKDEDAHFVSTTGLGAMVRSAVHRGRSIARAPQLTRRRSVACRGCAMACRSGRWMGMTAPASTRVSSCNGWRRASLPRPR